MRQKLMLITFILAATVALVPACGLLDAGESESLATTTPQGPTPAATPLSESTPGVTLPITPTSSTPRLVIWIPPDITNRSEQGSAIFADQVLAFTANHPDLEVRIERKPVTGQGGILNYLRTGRSITSGILPDLIALPSSLLRAAAQESLIFPLDSLIDPSLTADLYPAASSLVQVNGQTMGYPFALTNLTHLAYNQSAVDVPIPLVWEELRQANLGELAFAASGNEGARLGLQFYLALGGALTNEAGQPGLQLEPLEAALEAISQASSSGLLSHRSSNAVTLEDSWQLFQSGSALMVQTSADQFLDQLSADLSFGYSPIPGPSGALVPLIDGWAWALSATAAENKALAVELISQLVAEPEYAEWTAASHYLPSRDQVVTQWGASEPYYRFLQQELARAQMNPVAGGAEITTLLGDAVFDVVSLAKSPRQAAEQAAAAFAP